MLQGGGGVVDEDAEASVPWAVALRARLYCSIREAPDRRGRMWRWCCWRHWRIRSGYLQIRREWIWLHGFIFLHRGDCEKYISYNFVQQVVDCPTPVIEA